MVLIVKVDDRVIAKKRVRKSPQQRAISTALNALESGNPGIAYNALSAVAK